MSNYNRRDIEDFLEEWNDTRKELARLERKLNTMKTRAGRIMDSRDVNSLRAGCFTLRRRRQTTTTMKKRNVPNDVWNRYSTQSRPYPVFTLSTK